jgi:protein-S-isoprenylcysteine O-methyltransferase Ste14
MATPPQNQWLNQDTEVQRAAAAKRLKTAQRSMIVSGLVTVLLLVVTISAFVNGRYSDAANRGQTSVFGAVSAVLLLRFAYRGWRLYSTWSNLKEAQEHHRSLQ